MSNNNSDNDKRIYRALSLLGNLFSGLYFVSVFFLIGSFKGRVAFLVLSVVLVLIDLLKYTAKVRIEKNKTTK